MALNGHKHTKESKEKMSEIKMGKKNPFYGRHHTKETKERISKGNIGRNFSGETLKKMSEAKKDYIPWNKGEKCPQFSGINNPFYGKSHTLETKKKLSIIRLGIAPWNKGKTGVYSEEVLEKMRLAKIGKNIGAKNPSWQGGISKEPYAFEFNKQLKELIRNRDGYKCQLCGMPECENIVNLSIHHIDYIKKNCLPNNLIALCSSCNAKVNFNRDYWTEYFKRLKRGI